jgi:imidazolonepropionase-like amidohydrolase
MRIALSLFLVVGVAHAQTLSPAVKELVKVDAPLIALVHARVIDGTGAPARADQTVVVEGGRIRAVGDSARTPQPKGAQVIDLAGRALLPGLVGMHDHLFCTALRDPSSTAILLNEVARSFPRLYLASGVTTIRTAGSIEPYTDLNVKRLIDSGLAPGPKIFVTGPYLEGQGARFTQMHELRDADDARRLVEYWAGEGVTSFKVYMHISRAELRAAIDAAHARKLKVTGHLCSIGYREAAALGIDNLEHGFLVDTEFVPGKQPDVCPASGAAESLLGLDVESEPVKELMRDLVAHHVAVTSTLPVFEMSTAKSFPRRVLEVMLPEAAMNALATRLFVAALPKPPTPELLKKGMALERAFVRAGGLLVAGSDPTGIGGVLAGFADQREVELLVEAGFTPLEAIHIATQNGAELLGEAARIGSITVGKQADLVVVRGDPSVHIADLEQVELVFKDGVGYDPQKLIDSVRGTVGLQ